jgi:hypothetical protein
MNDPRIPTSSTIWQIWHQDMFDRDTPASLETTGDDILWGLYWLWIHTIREGITDTGLATSSYFYLTWGEQSSNRVDAGVNPFDNLSLMKIRQWAAVPPNKNNIPSQDKTNPVVWSLAIKHYELLKESPRWKDTSSNPGTEATTLLDLIGKMDSPEQLL